MAVTKSTFLLVILINVYFSSVGNGAVLEEDRVDVLYHSYDGGGMKIDGPAILLRKKTSESVALSAYYYVDTISSASVDVMSTASPYSEKRLEGQLGIEYLHDKTTMLFNVRQSDEDDYLAQSVNFTVSHDTFGDLTNLSLGFAFSDNEIGRNGDDLFEEESQQYRIRAGINQILTRNLSVALAIESVADEGYLNNPYRTVRYVDPSLPSGVGYQSEIYPQTRNSFSTKLSASYYLPYRAALFFHYRYFSDSRKIDSADIELSYRHPIGQSIELEFKARYYQQTKASFYSDLFPYQNAQNFLARDKELSDFDDLTPGFSVTYSIPSQFLINNWRSEASLQWDYISFNYNDFRDPTAEGILGEEPLYGFSAHVIRAFFSVYF
ncbi:DUF3570 domain-containing protein [Colwellia sp. MSW7]|uniref:DUF3570 domain-containing protein n=1 Tax=Colwellia maritima TaxID=2912588 RepID=A0ABS9X2H9_9GAMM|nr:DUF3570 domain-containing protein [Colwellia maritima]